ncbi:MAG: TenA family protein [Cyanobacteria bacterium P01_A01_bin.3]
MTIAQSLWQANQELAIVCLNHPFVKGIGDGSLARERFAYYVGQDAFFLESFMRAYSIAAAKAPDWQGTQQFHELAAGVLDELQLHGSFAREWDVDIASVQPGKSTRQYTDFLLATAWSQSVGITTAAMLPCMKLYGYLGTELASSPNEQHVYRDWIETYSSDEFFALVRQLETLAEQYISDTSAVKDAYRYAMQCELDFFQAAWDVAW